MKKKSIVNNYYNCSFGKEREPENGKKNLWVWLFPAIISNIDRLVDVLKPVYTHIEGWFKEY